MSIRKVLVVMWFLPVLLMMLSISACGDGEESSPGQGAQTQGRTKTYGTDPESSGSLLRDASEEIQSKIISVATGVHFTMDSTTSTAGTSVFSQGEGDMVFPDRVRMTTRNIVNGQTVEVEIIAIEGQTYTRSSATGGMWRSSSGGAAPPDPQSVKSYMDFARSSRNFGQETLRGGRKTYHVQVDVDSELAAEDAKKRTSDPAMQQAIEATKSSVVTVDLWIGIDDLLIYQEKVAISNPVTGLVSETNLNFSDWGRVVEISRPCEAC